MKVTIYTINNCGFCAQEKEYLTSKSISFEEKNIETRREYLSEMLEKSDKFAGVPFTLVEKDDDTVVKLKGFTKEEFDGTFGQSAESTSTPVQTMEAAVQAPASEVTTPPAPVVSPPVVETLPEPLHVPESQANASIAPAQSETPAAAEVVPPQPEKVPTLEVPVSPEPTLSPLTPPSLTEVSVAPDVVPSDGASTSPSTNKEELQGVLETLETLSKSQQAPTPESSPSPVVPQTSPVSSTQSTPSLPPIPDFPK